MGRPIELEEEPALSALELLRIAPLPEAGQLAGCAPKTLQRNYPELIVRVSKRRLGMRVGDALRLRRPVA